MKLNRMREEMINSFIDCLKKDTIPWHRGWSSERPFNAVTNTEYHGANALWLTYNQQAQLYKDPRWCTFKQAQSKGWKIKQGSKGTKLIQRTQKIFFQDCTQKLMMNIEI